MLLATLGVAGFTLMACGSADDDASNSGTGGTGGAAPPKNVYVNQVRGLGGCLVRPLSPGTDGRIGCSLTEARVSDGSQCPACTASPGRTEVADAKNVVPAVRQVLTNTGECDQDGKPACDDFCFCDLVQFSGEELLTCESSETDPGTQDGFCYVDRTIDANGDGTSDANPALLAMCSVSEPRLLRYMGENLPSSDALLYVACEDSAPVE
ncbi:MAG TPA: hypothetical protein VGQ57_11725 [Polyangiaceae bacterium]|nr:hypothetical protein [Polyangiaceae bacterium]